MNSKRKGTIAEVKIAADLLAKGYNIAIPEGDYLPYDIICIGKNFYKVQVKSCKILKNGAIKVSLWKNPYISGKVLHTKRYSKKNDVDVFAVYIPATDDCFYFDAAKIKHARADFTVRYKYPENGNKRHVNLLKNYIKFPLP